MPLTQDQTSAYRNWLTNTGFGSFNSSNQWQFNNPAGWEDTGGDYIRGAARQAGVSDTDLVSLLGMKDTSQLPGGREPNIGLNQQLAARDMSWQQNPTTAPNYAALGTPSLSNTISGMFPMSAPDVVPPATNQTSSVLAPGAEGTNLGEGTIRDNSWLQRLNFNSNQTGGEYYDEPTGRSYVPIFSPGSYNGADNYTPGEITGYRGYNFRPGMYADASQLNGTPYDIYDTQGNPIGTGTWEGLGGLPPWAYAAIPIMAAAGAQLFTGAGVAGAGAGASSLPTLPTLETLSPEILGSTLSEFGAGAGGLSTLPALETLSPEIVGNTLPELSGGGSLYGLGTGSSGTGLQATPGTGLNLASTTGAPGIQATTGPGLSLATTTGAPGLDAAVAGNALLAGAGLNPGSIAYGTGSVLTPGALSGTYTMADGTIVPGYTSTGVPTLPGGTTNTGTGGSNPPGGGVGGGNTGGGSNNNSGLDLNGLVRLLMGAADTQRQQGAANRMIDWLNEQMNAIDRLYAPGSPEYNYLWEQMSRNDAAAGRNSQYGPRSVDLAARIAEIKTNNRARLVQGIANNYAGALNQRAGATSGISGALGNYLSNPSNVTNLSSLVGSIINGFL